MIGRGIRVEVEGDDDGEAVACVMVDGEVRGTEIIRKSAPVASAPKDETNCRMNGPYPETGKISTLAERAQEIERLKTSKSIWCMHCLADFQVKDAPDAIETAKAHELVCLDNPLRIANLALTARAEAAEAGWKAIGELFKTGGMHDPAFLVGQVTAEHEHLQAAEATVAQQAEGLSNLRALLAIAYENNQAAYAERDAAKAALRTAD